VRTSFGKSSSCVGDGMLVNMRLDHSLVADCESGCKDRRLIAGSLRTVQYDNMA
jgi:hypothetical protein